MTENFLTDQLNQKVALLNTQRSMLFMVTKQVEKTEIEVGQLQNLIGASMQAEQAEKKEDGATSTAEAAPSRKPKRPKLKIDKESFIKS